MTDRRTLQLRDPGETSDDTPALKKKGRGWEISEKRLDAIHERARYLRRHSTEAHKALAARFAKEDFGKYKFTRHTVVGSAILDFVSHPLGLAIAIDEEGQDDRVAKRRDKSLAAMNARYREKETARRAHQSKYGSTPRRPRAPRRDDRK